MICIKKGELTGDSVGRLIDVDCLPQQGKETHYKHTHLSKGKLVNLLLLCWQIVAHEGSKRTSWWNESWNWAGHWAQTRPAGRYINSIAYSHPRTMPDLFLFYCFCSGNMYCIWVKQDSFSMLHPKVGKFFGIFHDQLVYGGMVCWLHSLVKQYSREWRIHM